MQAHKTKLKKKEKSIAESRHTSSISGFNKFNESNGLKPYQ